MWKIGPECVAQLRKLVVTRIRNGAERSAWPTDNAGSCTAPGAVAPAACTKAGGRRTSHAAGIISAAASAAMICIAVRQSWRVTSHAAVGDIVIGAMPMPADTSDTARPRRVSNQPVTQAIIGAKIAAALKPTTTPNSSWNVASDGASRSAYEETDWHQQQEERFAAEIAEELYRMEHAHRFRELVVVAPPKMLGDLRAKLHPEVANCVVAEVAKDLTGHPVPELGKLLS